MRTTVCVATKNRTDMLHQLLWSLIRQQYPAWDLLIVDDSDEPVPWDRIGVYPRLFSEMKRTGHDVRIAAGPRVNRIGAAFQVGLTASALANQLFLRVDDDAWLEPDYLARLVSVMEDPDVGACGGLFLHPGGELETLSPGDVRYRHTAVEHLSDRVNIQWFRHDSDEPIPVEHLTANILFNRKWLERIGGFEAHLYSQHRDETQVSWRLHVEGARLLVNPRAIAWHLRSVNGGARGHHPDVYLNDHRTFMAQRRTMLPGIHLHLGHAIGDGLMATPMLHVLRRMNPDRNIAVSAPWATEVLTGNPAVDELASNPLDAQRTVRLDQSVYGWASAHGWKGHLAEAYCRMFNLPAPEDLTPRLYLDDLVAAGILPVGQEDYHQSLPRIPDRGPGQARSGDDGATVHRKDGGASHRQDAGATKKYVVIAPWSTAKTFDFYGPSGNKNWFADRWAEIVARVQSYHLDDSQTDAVGAHGRAPANDGHDTSLTNMQTDWRGRPSLQQRTGPAVGTDCRAPASDRQSLPRPRSGDACPTKTKMVGAGVTAGPPPKNRRQPEDAGIERAHLNGRPGTAAPTVTVPHPTIFPTMVIQIRRSEDEPVIDGVDDVWTGRPLREVFQLIKNAALVISVDTMAHHAAAALGVPSVVLWGRSKPEHFGYRKDFIVNIEGKCPGLLIERKMVGAAVSGGPTPTMGGRPVGATVPGRPFANDGPTNKDGGAETPHPTVQVVKVRQDRPCINGDQWAMDQQVCPIEGHPCMAGITVDQVWEAVKQLTTDCTDFRRDEHNLRQSAESAVNLSTDKEVAR